MIFSNWCAANGLSCFPASPATVAAYAEYLALFLVPSKVSKAITDISRTYTQAGLADPTRSDVVTDMLNQISGRGAPNDWDESERALFRRLPWNAQTLVLRIDSRRRKAERDGQGEVDEGEQEDNGAPQTAVA